METATATRPETLHAEMLIGGTPVGSAERLEVRNPAHPDEVVGSIPRGTPAAMDRAVAAARAAQPAWAALSATGRAAVLADALDRVAEGVEERATLYVRENGKTLVEARAELSDLAPRARHTLSLAPELDATHDMEAPNGRTLVGPVPYGVVLCIVPWNAPVSLAAMQMIPALLTGNAVVLKVPESCPLALMRTAAILAAGLPRGLLNIVTGLPGEIGEALTGHPDIGKIAFVGSIPSARTIIRSAAGTIKGVTAELGGNDPAILLDDADLDEATMRRMATIVFRMAGQVCMAIKRIYVPAALHDRFVEAFAAATDRVVVGDGLTPGVSMGPLHTHPALDRARAYLAEAEAAGATIRPCGTVPDAATFAAGHFLRPTLVTNIPDDARLVVEEQFCPAIPILRYDDRDDALRRANATVFGLGGSVWGRDVARAAAVARRIAAGTVFVNTHGTNAVNRRAPYGGVKQSGMGRRAGIEGLREYVLSQTLTTFEEA